MPYTLPVFNLTCNIHRGDGFFPPGTPLESTPSCNLSPGRREITEILGAANFFMFILLPASTDVRDPSLSAFGNGDAIEAPAGSGIWYECLHVADVAKGFANEYRRAVCSRALAPVPLP